LINGEIYFLNDMDDGKLNKKWHLTRGTSLKIY